MSHDEIRARLNIATTAAMDKWNEVEPDHPISASFVASWADAVRAALKAAENHGSEKSAKQRAALDAVLGLCDEYQAGYETGGAPFANLVAAEFRKAITEALQ